MLRLLRAPQQTTASYDIVIVGSGLSGCLVASRVLAKKPSARIAVVEEGSLPVKGLFAEAPFLASYIPKLPWTRKMCSSYSARHGRVVGGSCAIAEGPFVVRGSKEEYEDIASLYGSESILRYNSYYAEVMHDVLPSNRSPAPSLNQSLNNKVPVVFPSLRQLNSDVNAKFQQSCEATSLRSISEIDGDCEGFGPTRALLKNGRRFSPTDLIRDYDVDLYSGTFATQLIFNTPSGSASEVTGVSVRSSSSSKGSPTVDLCAQEVVLCAGGVGTPSLLLRSGVGPEALLGGYRKCRHNLPDIGQSVIEAPRFQVDFKLYSTAVTKTVAPAYYTKLLKWRREFLEEGAGPLSSFAEWQAYIRSNETSMRPDTRVTFCEALHNGLPSWDAEGFTLNIELTQTQERGRIVPATALTTSAEEAAASSSASEKKERDIQYQYSYTSDSTLNAMDDAVLWSTMMCDSTSNIRYRIGDVHPFASFGARAMAPELAAPETTRELVRATVVGSGDVYGACPMGAVVDPNTLRVKGLKNLTIGDVSVIPIPMMANKLALGQVTACMASESL